MARESDVAFGEFIDYRGVRVLGAARRINAVGDSVARKVDRDEALLPYHGCDGQPMRTRGPEAESRGPHQAEVGATIPLRLRRAALRSFVPMHGGSS